MPHPQSATAKTACPSWMRALSSMRSPASVWAIAFSASTATARRSRSAGMLASVSSPSCQRRVAPAIQCVDHHRVGGDRRQVQEARVLR
ncbi:MAG TPA: hypothetical protein VGM53_08650 [Streptosporangiaceae bacterium]